MSKAASDQNRRKLFTATAVRNILILLFAVLFIVFIPRYYSGRLEDSKYSEWLARNREPSIPVIEIWHIVGFKPYAGSLGTWLDARADEYSKKYIGIHFLIRSLSVEEAQMEFARGKHPDVVSFSKGSFPNNDLYDGYSPLPYCASGKVLVFDPISCQDKSIDEMINESGTVEEFRKGDAAACVTDIRGAGDLYRSSLMGKLQPFETAPVEAGGDLIQFIGIYRGIDEIKLPYSIGFIESILTKKSQEKLCGIGLLPVIEGVETDFEQEWLEALYELFRREETF